MGRVGRGLRYFSMAFLAFKGQNSFVKRFLFINLGHGLNFVTVSSLVFRDIDTVQNPPQSSVDCKGKNTKVTYL